MRLTDHGTLRGLRDRRHLLRSYWLFSVGAHFKPLATLGDGGGTDRQTYIAVYVEDLVQEQYVEMKTFPLVAISKKIDQYFMESSYDLEYGPKLP